MASIVEDPKGRKRILFVAGDGSRKAVRLGKCDRKSAEGFKLKLELLIGGKISGGNVPDEVSRWLAAIDDRLHAKLAAVDLVAERQAGKKSTLAPFLDGYIAGRADVKPNTRIGLGQARRNLVAFFGESKPLAAITEGDAEEYWRYLIGKLSINTARRLCGRAKQFFRFATRKGMIRANPFVELESNVRSNPERRFFITREMADKVNDACPDAEWRLIFALARYGGLRCPSEHLALKWADVDWDRGRVRVPSPKTEHLEGRASRVIPLFPELRKPLLEVFDLAHEGAVYVITRYRQPNSNLRTQFERIIKRAGLEPWPKLFHNLRSTRQTELAESLPAHVVCAWMGNTEAVANAHYLQITDEHFRQAIDGKPVETTKAAQNAAHSASISANQDQSQNGAINENHRENPHGDEPVRVGGWPLSESNRYALAGTGF